MKYDFDTLHDRRGSGSLKWNVADGELPLWVADMDFQTAPAVTAALVKRAQSGIYGYHVVPDEWYQAIIGWWKTRHGFMIEREWLVFTTGVVPAISSMVKRLTNLGDNVVVMTPVYDIFFHSIENAGRHTLECALAYKDGKYSIDFAALEEALQNPLSTLLILCNPHNPVGKIWEKEELAKIGELCRQYGVTVISDEIHCDITEPTTCYVPFASASETCKNISVTCLSASKAFNLAGLQSAGVFVPDKTLRQIVERGLNSDEVAEPNCFAVAGTVAAFTQGGDWLDELNAYLAENKRYVKEYLKKNLPILRPASEAATYLLWLDCGAITADSKEFCSFLRENTGLFLSAGSEYRGNGNAFVRINLACPRARLEDGLNRLNVGVTKWLNRT